MRSEATILGYFFLSVICKVNSCQIWRSPEKVSRQNTFCSVSVERIFENIHWPFKCNLTSTDRLAHPAGFNGAVQLSPQKENV